MHHPAAVVPERQTLLVVEQIRDTKPERVENSLFRIRVTIQKDRAFDPLDRKRSINWGMTGRLGYRGPVAAFLNYAAMLVQFVDEAPISISHPAITRTRLLHASPARCRR